MRPRGSCPLQETLMEAQQSQVLHRFIDFYWQGPSPTICPGTAFEASSGFPQLWVNHLVP